MALINCSHCNHKVSSDALICPNCSKPIQVLSDRVCDKCSERLPKQKRKCTKCGYVNNNSKSQNMANQNSNNILILLIVIVLLVGGYFYLNTNNDNSIEVATEIVIPDGTYKLTNARKETAALCNLSFLHYGKTIRISSKKAYTTTVQEIPYDIFNKGGHDFQIGPSTSTCFYSDNKLTFICQGEEIIFERQY